MKDSAKRQKQERRYSEWLDTLPQNVKRFVHIGVFRFVAPRWWGDMRLLAGVIRLLKIAVVILYVITIILALMTLSMNNKNKAWDLYTFNETGEVQWIAEPKKLR